MAAQAYINHLKQKRQTGDAIEVLQSLGRHEEALLLRYTQCTHIADHNRRIKALRQLSSEQLKDSSFYQKMVSDYTELLEQQRLIDTKDSAPNMANNPLFRDFPRASHIYDKSLLTTLYYSCMYHWHSSEGHAPVKLRQRYGLTERQLLWCVVRARGRVRHFCLPDQLVALVNTKASFQKYFNIF